MKWIQVRQGIYKYVEDTDERPPVILKNKKGIPSIVSRPPWAAFEKAQTIGDSTSQLKASDAFIEERSRWTATSAKYRNWEAGRRKEWQKNKPAWRKKRMKEDPTFV